MCVCVSLSLSRYYFKINILSLFPSLSLSLSVSVFEKNIISWLITKYIPRVWSLSQFACLLLIMPLPVIFIFYWLWFIGHLISAKLHSYSWNKALLKISHLQTDERKIRWRPRSGCSIEPSLCLKIENMVSFQNPSLLKIYLCIHISI